jgi:hypothetical protein
MREKKEEGKEKRTQGVCRERRRKQMESKLFQTEEQYKGNKGGSMHARLARGLEYMKINDNRSRKLNL